MDSRGCEVGMQLGLQLQCNFSTTLRSRRPGKFSAASREVDRISSLPPAPYLDQAESYLVRKPFNAQGSGGAADETGHDVHPKGCRQQRPVLPAIDCRH